MRLIVLFAGALLASCASAPAPRADGSASTPAADSTSSTSKPSNAASASNPTGASTSTPASSATSSDGARPRAKRLTIVGINDTHGALLETKPPKWARGFTDDSIGGVDWFAGYLAAIRAEARDNGAGVVVLDGGDMFQGTLISNVFKGKSVVDAYDALSVTAAAVGNHEFDFGLDVLQERMRQAKYPILVANVFQKGTRTRPSWARPTMMIEVEGVKVGIIGLSTVETATVTNPLNVETLEFAPGGPIAAQLADELRAQGATVVLVTAHAGPLASNPPRPDSLSDQEAQKIAQACAGKIDALVSGHHHTPVGPPPLLVAGIPIIQSGSKLTQFSVIDLDLDAAGKVTGVHVNEGTEPREGGPQLIAHTKKDGSGATWRKRPVTPDAKVAALVKGYDMQVAKLRETVLGSTEVALQKGGTDDLLANFTADALRSGAGGGLAAQYAFQNSGGLRITEIPAGPITFGQIFDLTPFDNEQVVLTVKASDVRDALEAILRAGKGPLKVSGLTYTIDWTRRDPKVSLMKAPRGSLVTEVIDVATGKPLCRTETCDGASCKSTCAEGSYTLALTDFLANGGDGLELLKGKPRKVAPVLARDVIVGFVKDHVPVTAALLGSTKAGGPLRVRQVGQTAPEHD